MPRPATVLRDGAPADDAAGIERRPGEFARNDKGAPWVVSAEKLTDAGYRKAELIELCAKHGIEVPEKADVATLKGLLGDLAKRGAKVLYGRPSSLGKQIENTTNLQKWSERAVALGLHLDYRIAEEPLSALHDDQLTLDDPDARDVLDAIAVKAKNRARAGIAAERGTHGHELTEDHDNNEVSLIERISRGEGLGLPPEVQYALVAAWAKMLGQLDVGMLAVEATCVDDVWRQAGTLDRICRLNKDTQFLTTAGTYVTLPAGWCGILDIKTGKLRLDSGGFVSYWHGYAVQLASYAQSRPYDPDTDRRGEWPFEIDQQWAIIAHLDILAALDGEAKCRLVLVDLEAGRHAGALCVAARDWEKRVDVFSIPTDDLCVSVPVEGFTEGRAVPAITAADAPVTAEGATASATPSANLAAPAPTEQPAEEVAPSASSATVVCEHAWRQVGRCAYCDHCGLRFQGKAPKTPEAAAAVTAVLDAARNMIAEHGREPAADARPTGESADSPVMSPDERRAAQVARYKSLSDAQQVAYTARKASIDTSDPAAVDALLDEIDPFARVIPAPEPRPASVAPARHVPDEGPLADKTAVATLRCSFDKLPEPDRLWIAGLTQEGIAAGVDWRTNALGSVRRFEIGRAVIHLAGAGRSEADRNDILRGLLGHVTGREEVEQLALPLGAAVGTLDVDEAKRLALAVDDLLALAASA